MEERMAEGSQIVGTGLIEKSNTVIYIRPVLHMS